MFIELTQRNSKAFLQNMDKVFSIGEEEGPLSDDGRFTLIHLRDDGSQFLLVKETPEEIREKICIQMALEVAIQKDFQNILQQQIKKEKHHD